MTELLSAFTLAIDYVYGYRLTCKINERLQYGIPELHRDGISSCNSGIPSNSYQFRFYAVPESEGIPRHDGELDLTNSGIPGMISADSGIG